MEGPGVGRTKIPELDRATDKYTETRDTRMQWTQKEVTTRDNLVALMKKNNLTQYYRGDEVVKLVEGKTKVSVKSADAEEDKEEAGLD